MYSNYSNYPSGYYSSQDDRFFIAPFLLGGLAGGALGYGIASNNNNASYYPVYPMYPVFPTYSTTYPTYPTYSNSNYYYY